MNSFKTSGGFTMVELIVVIVILGILAASALPRFLDASDDAHISAVKGMGGAFASGVDLAHSGWLLDKTDQTVDMDGVAVHVNSDGWPNGRGSWTNTASANDCRTIWSELLKGAPSTATSANQAEYYVTYNNNTCAYRYEARPQLLIYYNNTNGNVAVDSTI